MLRATSYTMLVLCLFSLAAYRSGNPKFLERPFPVNTTVANFFLAQERPVPNELDEPIFANADSVDGLSILMLNYSAYDSAYVSKVKGLIAKRLPGVEMTDFWQGSTQDLNDLLAEHQIVVVTYAAKGSLEKVKAYGKVLANYVRKGGAVVFSGTDQFGMLQHYGLFDLDFGYFCSDLDIKTTTPDHPVLQGAPADFSLANYVYPLDISDPDFTVLAKVRDYPVLGYRSVGSGNVVYLGLEYYYDESVSSHILENTLRWLAPEKEYNTQDTPTSANNADWTAKSITSREERLFVGSGSATTPVPTFDLKIYPNPYFEKATLDINLEKSAPVSVEMTDETGVTVSVLLPYRILDNGFYRLELPNVPNGVYFVKCQAGTQTTVRKVVKLAVQ